LVKKSNISGAMYLHAAFILLTKLKKKNTHTYLQRRITKDEGGSRVGLLSFSDEAPWRGPLWGRGSFTGNPGRYVQIVSGCGHLSP
jgi:hypothetical protein